MDIQKTAKQAITEVGGYVALANKLYELDQAVPLKQLYWRIQKWPINGVPPQYVLKVEKLSGVSRHKLRPDIYGDAA